MDDPKAIGMFSQLDSQSSQRERMIDELKVFPPFSSRRRLR